MGIGRNGSRCSRPALPAHAAVVIGPRQTIALSVDLAGERSSPFSPLRQPFRRRLGKAIVEPIRRQVVLDRLDGDGGRGFDMDRPIRSVEFDNRVLAVLMDLHALSFRAERARRPSESIVVKVIVGHYLVPSGECRALRRGAGTRRRATSAASGERDGCSVAMARSDMRLERLAGKPAGIKVDRPGSI